MYQQEMLKEATKEASSVNNLIYQNKLKMAMIKTKLE